MNEKSIDKVTTGLVESVIDDAKNLVGHRVPLGTRIEAGVDIAADVSSFVLGPEDAAAERAAVFAIKEGIEHAPQIATLAELAPGFMRTKQLLADAGHALVDSHPERGLLETKNAIYKIIEQSAHHAEGLVGDVAAAGREAFEKGKNFGVHALKLTESLENHILKLGQAGYHELKGLKAIVATSEMQIEDSIGTLESGRLIERVKNVFGKVREASDVGETIKTGVETAAKVIGAGVVLDKAAEYVEEHARDVVHGLGHRIKDLLTDERERKGASLPAIRTHPDGTQRIQELREPLTQGGRILFADAERITQDIGRGHTFTYRTEDLLRDPDLAQTQLQMLQIAAANQQTLTITTKHGQVEISDPIAEHDRARDLTR